MARAGSDFLDHSRRWRICGGARSSSCSEPSRSCSPAPERSCPSARSRTQDPGGRTRDRARDRRHGLGGRAHLRRPLQPGDHVRFHPHAADSRTSGGRLLGRAAARRSPGSSTASLDLSRANRDASNLGAPSVHTIDIGAALVVEALITFFLVWVVFAMTTEPQRLTRCRWIRDRPRIVFGMLIAYPLTGGSFNPARAFGPELISNTWSDAGSTTSARLPAVRSRRCSTRRRSTCVRAHPPMSARLRPGSRSPV